MSQLRSVPALLPVLLDLVGVYPFEIGRSSGEMIDVPPTTEVVDSRVLMRRPVGFAFHRAPYGVSLHAL